jgi:hypothetical protein
MLIAALKRSPCKYSERLLCDVQHLSSSAKISYNGKGALIPYLAGSKLNNQSVSSFPSR